MILRIASFINKEALPNNMLFNDNVVGDARSLGESSASVLRDDGYDGHTSFDKVSAQAIVSLLSVLWLLL